MLVVIAVSTAAMVAIVTSVLYFYRTNAATVEQAFAIDSARKGVEFVVRDLREATYSEEGAYPIVSAGPTSLTFYSDIDRDSSVERIRYFLDGTNLKKGVTDAFGDPLTYDGGLETISLISDSVRNGALGVPIFSFFDSAGNSIDGTAVTEVSFVTINLTVNINPSRLPEDFTLRSSTTLRNVKTNL
jgi:hypothetical protein